MSSVVEKRENNEVELTIDVDQQTFEQSLQHAFRLNAKHFMIPGFRKGKAPMALVTKYYGEGILYEDAIDHAANPAYQDALKEHDLKPVAQPVIDILDIGRDKGLKFSVKVTIKPEVTLGAYEQVEAVRPLFPVDDDAVEADIKRVRERNSRMIPVEDRGIEDGDTVNIDYEGLLDGVAFEGGSAEAYDLTIGSKAFIPGFEEQLIGHKADETFPIDVTFPEDYQNEELAGKAVVFNITVNNVKMRELPELDDEFAKDVSEFDTLEAYRDDVRKKLEEDADKRSRNIFEDNVVRQVAQNATVDIPLVMVDQEIDRMVDQQKQQMTYQGIEFEQFLSYMGQTLEAFREQMRDSAQERVQIQLVLEAIGEKLDLDITDEEYDEELNNMASMYGVEAETLKEQAPEGQLEFVKEAVLHRKLVAWLVDHAVAVDPPEPAQEDDEPTEEAAESEKEPPADPERSADA